MGWIINPRYCGTMNEVSTQFCNFLNNFKLNFQRARVRTGAIAIDFVQIHLTPAKRATVKLRDMPLPQRDPVELEIFKNLFHSIAEEMGAALRRTAFSPNIKERRDYSCAVFNGAGNVIAMGDHMPVHLGSMPMSVRAAIDAGAMDTGDVVMLNDPFRGGTHLPDITLVAPVYVER